MRRFALILTLFPLLAAAAPPPGSEPLPDAPPPPQYGPNDATPEPQITIIQRDSATYQEYRINNRLYMIKVIPKEGAPYYLVDEQGQGVWHRYDGQDTGLVVPRWVILRF